MFRSKCRVALPLAIAFLVLAACRPETVEVTRLVEHTVLETRVVEIEGEMQIIEVTRLVTKSEEVTAEPTATLISQGGDVIQGGFGEVSALNPIISADRLSEDIIAKMFLALLTLESFTGRVIGQIAESWDVSEDGLVFTFHLRDDISWSDGTPVTANDVVFTWDAINTASVASPLRSNFQTVDSWQALDDYTVELTLNTVDCTLLTNLTTGVLPADAYDGAPENIVDSPENYAPTITNGPFTFVEWVRFDHGTLAANPDYYLGAPKVDTWTWRLFPDQSAAFAAFLAGETDMTYDVGHQFISIIEGEIASGQPINIRKWFNNGSTFVAFNLANPENPQNGWEDLDGDGKWTEGEPPLEQDPHPVLGDVAVRRAIANAVDYTGIINKVVFGQGVVTLANVWPSIEWAYNNDIEPYTQDLELAQSILDDAGWVDGDGDGVREKDRQPLAFSLMTNVGNEVRENIGVLMKDTLDRIGFEITLDYIEFGTVVQNLLGQTYDAVIIGFGGGPPEPDDRSQFSYKADEVGAGYNFVSYYDEQYEANLEAGLSVPGCAEADRAPFYKDNQAIHHEDVPYAWLYVELKNAVWWDRLQNYDPNPWNNWYNIHEIYLLPQ